MTASARLLGLFDGKRMTEGISSDHSESGKVFSNPASESCPNLPWGSLIVEETNVETDCNRRSRSLSKPSGRKPGEARAAGAGVEDVEEWGTEAAREPPRTTGDCVLLPTLPTGDLEESPGETRGDGVMAI
mmetsp:Transcript_71142/g.123394  ORF Transcript_71142/g.123394 Transcript_71142/m.123394 type:complete len:131 (+) Transcript_71142:986-1378(+)